MDFELFPSNYCLKKYFMRFIIKMFPVYIKPCLKLCLLTYTYYDHIFTYLYIVYILYTIRPCTITHNLLQDEYFRVFDFGLKINTRKLV